jgi:hypothetical protein
MATISFLAGEGFSIENLNGSGLGFYGPGSFGNSVRVGEYQDNTWITDATGAIQGSLVDNVKYIHPNSGQIPTNDNRVLQDIPNYLATLNIRFEHPTPVKVQNAQARAFDRNNFDAPPSGVTFKAAEVIHPWNTSYPTGPYGSGDTTWSTLGGSGGTYGLITYDPPLSLVDSPGVSGLSPSGVNTMSTQHDHYIVCSCSPDSIGSKTLFGLYVSMEYL